MQIKERKVKGNTLITLEADEGMYITDGTSYAKTVYLGLGANPDDFRDATEEEYKRKIENTATEGE